MSWAQVYMCLKALQYLRARWIYLKERDLLLCKLDLGLNIKLG